jgi:hypothetical protein
MLIVNGEPRERAGLLDVPTIRADADRDRSARFARFACFACFARFANRR